MVTLSRPADALRVRRPRPRIYLHIGTMKSGTTYLQHVMEANKEELAQAGFLFPGANWKEQARATAEVLGFQRANRRSGGTWNRLVAEMMAHRGQASVFSHEWLSYADPERARRVVEFFTGAEVHVILTVRDMARALPSQWQTSCRNAGTVRLPKMVGALRWALRSDCPAQNKAHRTFQRTQGVVRMLDVWVPLVGNKRFHVVTVPPSGSEPRLLWERFAEVIGVDPDVARHEPARTNATAFGHVTSEFLRRLNVQLRGVHRDMPAKDVLAHLRRDLAAREHDEPPVGLHRGGLLLAARWNRRVRSAITGYQVHFVGDLADLPVRRPDASAPPALFEPQPDQIVGVAASAAESLLRLANELRSRVPDEAGPPLAAVERDENLALCPPRPERWLDDPEPDVIALREVADLVRTCIRMSRRLARGRAR